VSTVGLQSGTRCAGSEGGAADGRPRRREARRDRHVATTQHGDDDLSKRAAAEAVDDEVDGRVGDDQKVADALVEEERGGAGLGVLAEQSYEQLRDESRSLADDEDQNDDDQHARDVVLGTAAVGAVLLSTAPCRRRPGTHAHTPHTYTGSIHDDNVDNDDDNDNDDDDDFSTLHRQYNVFLKRTSDER